MRRYINTHGVTYKMVKVSDLRIDYTYQRPPNNHKIRTIVNDFRWEFFGTVTVTPTKTKGKYQTADGNNRIQALKKLFGVKAHNMKIMVKIVRLHPGEVFRGINGNQSKVSRQQDFRVDYNTAKDKGMENHTTIIVDTLTKHGIGIAYGARKVGYTASPAAFHDVFNARPDVFNRVIKLFTKVFSQPDNSKVERAALDAHFIKGFAVYLKSSEYSIPKIERALIASRISSDSLLKLAKRANKKHGWQRYDCMAYEINKAVKRGLEILG